jgi:hypothetical protein
MHMALSCRTQIIYGCLVNQLLYVLILAGLLSHSIQSSPGLLLNRAVLFVLVSLLYPLLDSATIGIV